MSQIERIRIGRITGSREIRSLRKNGQLFRGRSVLIWISQNAREGEDFARVGVTTGKRFGNSVRRNRAKRRVRGCFMDLRHLLRPGRDYLIECRKALLEVDYQYLVNEIGDILSRY